MTARPFIKVAIPMTGEDEAAAIRDVVLSGNFVSGPKVEQFERAIADHLGVAHAVAVNSCTAALHLAYAAAGLGPGDEVIVPPVTFFSTVTSVLHQGATPVFADVDAGSFCLSADAVERAITEKTRAIVPVHVYGNAADMDAIMRVAERHNLIVIEDCAQSHGTTFNGRQTGSIGHMGALSFFATKHMTTGEGGMLVSNNSAWADRARTIRSHGMVNRDDHVMLGYNYRMTEIAAAMGLVQIQKLESNNERRIQHSLAILNALRERPRPWFRLAELDPRVRHTFFWCPLLIASENGYAIKDVVARLRERGVEVRQRYYEPLNRQPMLATHRFPAGVRVPDYHAQHFPNAEAIAGNIVGLPNHAGLTPDDIEYVVDTVTTLY